MKGFVHRWLAAVKQRPLILNSLTGSVLFLSSDALAQRIEVKGLASLSPYRKECNDEEEDWFNYLRLGTTGLLGVFFGGIVYPRAYQILDRKWPESTFRHIVTKSVVEIATVGIFVNSVSMLARGILVGRKYEEVVPHVAKEMPTVTMNDVRVWLPYNLVAFSVIPAFIRPTTTILMEASWQTYISIRSHDYRSPFVLAPSLNV